MIFRCCNRVTKLVDYHFYLVNSQTVYGQRVTVSRSHEIAATIIVDSVDRNVVRCFELYVVVLELLVGEYRGKEIATDWERCAVALSELTSAEVYTAVLAAYPRTADEAWCSTYEPSVRVVVRRTRLATKVGIGDVITHVVT